MMTLRVVAAVAAVVSAAIHVYLWFDGVKDQGTVGAMFVVNGVAGVVIAVLLLTWEHWLPAFLVLGFGASTLGAFFISMTVGLFGIQTGWSWYAWLAAAAEVVCIVAGAWLLLGATRASRRQSQDRVPV